MLFGGGVSALSRISKGEGGLSALAARWLLMRWALACSKGERYAFIRGFIRAPQRYQRLMGREGGNLM